MSDDETDPEEGDDADTIPAAPSDDDSDSALGDTDQHSDADA